MSNLSEPVDYKKKRTPDLQYGDLLKQIVDHGVEVGTQMEEKAKTVFGNQMRFDLTNGFPVITERDVSGSPFRQALGELIGFLNGARTQAELEEYGCKWWSPWVSAEKCAKRGLEPGDLGPGSYGAAWHDFPTSEGEPFNQVQALVDQINEKPHLRTHILTPFIPQYIFRGSNYKQRVVVVPCHGFVHVRVLNGKLHLHHFQRSADVPVGLVFNFIHYAALLLMLAQVTNHEPGELVYTVSDAHVYESQYEIIDGFMNRKPRPFPRLLMDKSVKNIFDFRVEHFELVDYDPHEPGNKQRIPTPV